MEETPLETRYSAVASTRSIHNVHRETIHGVDVLWEKPRTGNWFRECPVADDIKGKANTASSNVNEKPSCIGLPEERAIVDIALKQGLLVIAVSSTNRRSKCWNPSDVDPVGWVLQSFQRRYNNLDLPIYAFGASSGGAFVSSLATPLSEQYNIQLKGYISQIMAKPPLDPLPSLQCQVFITMPRDQGTRESAEQLVQQSDVSSSFTKHVQLPPLVITPTFFSSRIREITSYQSNQMYSALKEASWIDANGALVHDPRRPMDRDDPMMDWRKVLRKVVPLDQDTMVADKSPIAEVMNVAYGMHEMTRDGVKEALQFCRGTK
eukprot:Nitzschia sp. Nitz4//scaffold522_size6110//4165//5178//NITZ4_009187-RA/size6110-processed-gene-0.5-mRNA-1//-1//CDS//3329553943//5974//frame0